MTREPMTLRERGSLVEALSSSVRHGGHALGTAPVAIRRLLEDDAWRHFVTRDGKEVEPPSFEWLVTTPPLRGLGADMALIRRIIANEPDLVHMLTVVLKEAQPHGGDRRSESFKFDNVKLEKPPVGNATAQAHRRLRKDRPDLLARVTAGEISAHAAMVEAGFRPRTITVPLDVERAARVLRRHFTPEELAAIARWASLAENDL